ncbi:MFS transporter [Gallaecimonas pentaromativorans]|uniref:MFS transporter n=1 Tax=Gallaecimonas pentaromativorans TaxID=584787 RepID=UPI003A8D15F5
MDSPLSLQRLKTFPLLVWITLWGTFVSRGTFFMVWPFLAVLLHQDFGLNPLQIGLILSLAAVAGSILGFYVSALSDRFGRKAVLYCAGLLNALAFGVLAGAHSITGYVLGIMLTSVGRATFEPAAQALMGDQLPDAKSRELALQLRYFLINLGGALGPLLGVWAGLTAQQSTFYLTSASYVLLVALLAWAFGRGYRREDTSLARQGFGQTLSLLRQDHSFLLLILANILLMFVFAHIDSSLIQYLTLAQVPKLIELISMLILVNAVTVMVLQFPLLKMMARMPVAKRMQIGLVLMGAAQLWYAFNPMSAYWGWIGATLVLSLGEVILFPNINVQIDSMAPPRLRGAYFGAGNLFSIGWSMAPLVGGWMLEHYSGRALYLAMAACTLLVMVLYVLASRLPRPKWLEAELAQSKG